MTPGEVAERLFELEILFQVKERKPSMGGLSALFGGESMPIEEDFLGLGHNADKEEEDDENKVDDSKWLDVFTDKEYVRKFNAWFLSYNPPDVYKGKIIGQVMSAAIAERSLIIRMEDVPWGLKSGIISIACEYITHLEYKAGTLYITSKIGNLAIQIHEITASQCGT